MQGGTVCCLWHRVEPRRPERSTTKEAPRGHPAAAPWAVQANRLVGILRAAREEPAGRQGPCPLLLVPTNGTQHPRRTRCPHPVDRTTSECVGRHTKLLSALLLKNTAVVPACSPRWRRASRVIPSCPQLLSTATGSTLRRYQPAGRPLARARISSRNRRRTRFRTTAEPMRLGVANATQTPPAAGSTATRRPSAPSRMRRHPWNGAKPRRRGIRLITPTNGRDPWHGATSERRDHPWSSSACEIHAFWHADAYWVEMYVSRLSPDVTFKAIGSNALRLGDQFGRRNAPPNTHGVIRHFDPCGKRATFPAPSCTGGTAHTVSRPTHDERRVTRLGFSTRCGCSCG